MSQKRADVIETTSGSVDIAEIRTFMKPITLFTKVAGISSGVPIDLNTIKDWIRSVTLNPKTADYVSGDTLVLKVQQDDWVEFFIATRGAFLESLPLTHREFAEFHAKMMDVKP